MDSRVYVSSDEEDIRGVGDAFSNTRYILQYPFPQHLVGTKLFPCQYFISREITSTSVQQPNGMVGDTGVVDVSSKSAKYR